MIGQKTMADPMTAGDEPRAVAARPYRSSASEHGRRSPQAAEQSDAGDHEGTDHRGGEEDCGQ